MTIWILALVLLAAGAGLSLRQGAVRAAISFVGIVVAVLFAGILGKQLKPLFPHVGIHNPLLIWMLAPLVAFIVILILFKIAGFFVHRKVYLFYKYQAGDLRLALWERLNARLGLCIGLLNGTAYLLLVSFAIYNLSYWTIQIASSNHEPFGIRLLNRMGSDLDATGLTGAARSVMVMPDRYYQLADLAGFIRQNPQLKNRLESYPAFLTLAERDSFKQLGQDSNFQKAWQNQAPIFKLLKDPQIKAMLKNTDLITTIVGIVQANRDDLNRYLKTGQSPKYGAEKILGRWDFDLNASVGMLLIAHPNISPAEVRGVRSLWSMGYGQTVFIAAPDHQAFLENLPRFEVKKGAASVAEKLAFRGKWKSNGTNYEISLSGNGQHRAMTAHTEGLRLTLQSRSDSWAFERE